MHAYQEGLASRQDDPTLASTAATEVARCAAEEGHDDWFIKVWLDLADSLSPGDNNSVAEAERLSDSSDSIGHQSLIMRALRRRPRR